MDTEMMRIQEKPEAMNKHWFPNPKMDLPLGYDLDKNILNWPREELFISAALTGSGWPGSIPAGRC